MAYNYSSTKPLDCSGEFDTSSVKGKTAIVTGGASGIGAAYVRALAKAGALVVIADLSEDGAKKIQQEFPATTTAIRCDVLSWKDQLATFKKAIELSPSNEIDIVVANAGIAVNDSILSNDTSLSEPEEPKFPVLDVNINGVFYTTKLAQWYFEKQNSSSGPKNRYLILQASLAGYLDLISPQYSASKFAVRGLMRSLRHVAPTHGYNVGLIAPWYIATPILNAQMVSLIDGSGAQFAEVGDAATAMMRLVSDSKSNGRALAIVPRTWEGAARGFVDLEQDDFAEGSWMREAQENVFKPFQKALEQGKHIRGESGEPS